MHSFFEPPSTKRIKSEDMPASVFILFIYSSFWVDKFTDNKTVWNKI